MSYHCTEWKHIANGGIFLIIFFAPLSAYFLPAYADALPGMAGWLALIALMPFRKKERINLTLPDVLFLTVTGYCLLNLRGASHWTYLWQLTDCIGLWIWMRQQKNRRYPDILILLLCASGTIQALWGISQTGRLVTSLHSEFAATGSFGNPGPWGGYLAVTLSLACAIMTDRRCPPQKRMVMAASGVLMTCGLLLSGSRAAVLAVSVSLFLLATDRCDLLRKTRKRYLPVTILTILLFVGFLHGIRPHSSNARLHIWKVSYTLFTRAPLLGHGSGSFAREYMPAQAGFLDNADKNVRQTADSTTLAYNESVRLLCEQGTAGFLLILGLTVTCVIPLFRKDQVSPLSYFRYPVISILIFSQFSYPSEVSGLNYLLPVFLGIGASGTEKKIFSFTSATIQYLRNILTMAICLSAGILFLIRIQLYNWIAEYATYQEKEFFPASSALHNEYYSHDRYLLATFCPIAHLRGEYELSARYHLCLRQYVQSAGILLNLAEACEENGNRQLAIQYYKEAGRMMPGLVTPFFRIFGIYRDADQQTEATRWAEKVLLCPPKIENAHVSQIKKEAKKFILQNEKLQ